MVQPTTNPLPTSYLDGNYAPQLEEISAEDLTVEGTLPDDLTGVFVHATSRAKGAIWRR